MNADNETMAMPAPSGVPSGVKSNNKAIELTLVFPFGVKQLGHNRVVVETTALRGGPILTTRALDIIAPDLSDAEKDRLSDDIVDYALAQGLIRSIRVLR